MPLYRCAKCDAIENTATGQYWSQQLVARRAVKDFRPLCSECNPKIAKWHGSFPKEPAGTEWAEDSQGFLEKVGRE